VATPSAKKPVPVRTLVRKVEELVETVPSDGSLRETIELLAKTLTESLSAELGLVGGRMYQREGRSYRLVSTFGSAPPVTQPIVVSRDYPPLAICLREGLAYFAADDEGLDRDLEDAIGADEFAAIAVGGGAFVLAFDVAGDRSRRETLVSLGILRYGINQRIREEEVLDVYREARRIQTSILPREVPAYGTFDIAGRSVPMETVGGDFYDFISLSDKILGIAIADVSGHGLPAAMQVRDIYMGLRMGLGRDFKIVRTLERLARIVHQSTISSRFLSMVYGELELNGNFLYVNAGHPPPFHIDAAGEVTLLEQGGLVMGPVPDPTYERGYVSVAPGETLVLYTDGIVETHCAEHEGDYDEYGLDRLIRLVRSLGAAPAADVVRAVFEDVEGFCDCAPSTDDRTLVVVKRPA